VVAMGGVILVVVIAILLTALGMDHYRPTTLPAPTGPFFEVYLSGGPGSTLKNQTEFPEAEDAG